MVLYKLSHRIHVVWSTALQFQNYVCFPAEADNLLSQSIKYYLYSERNKNKTFVFVCPSATLGTLDSPKRSWLVEASQRPKPRASFGASQSESSGGCGRDRTCDPVIISDVLYH